jgi:hypothetical protein
MMSATQHGATYNVWDILERYCPREQSEPWCVKKLKAGRKEGRTAIDDDALRHAERHVGRHLHGAKMTRRETQRTQFGRAISWRVVTCPHMGNIPSKNISPQKTWVFFFVFVVFFCFARRTEDTLTDHKKKQTNKQTNTPKRIEGGCKRPKRFGKEGGTQNTDTEEKPHEFAGCVAVTVGWREGRGRFGIEQAYVLERDVARLHER